MSHVRALAAFAVVIALGVLAFGLLFVAAHPYLEFKEEFAAGTGFVLPGNSTAYKTLTLDSQGNYSLVISIGDVGGTVFSCSVSDASLEKWLQGQYNASWDGTQGSGLFYGVSGQCKIYHAEINHSESTVENVIFWNPETFSQAVTLNAYKDCTATQSSSILGFSLVAIGASGILANTVFLW
jgi:hypothetical protein